MKAPDQTGNVAGRPSREPLSAFEAATGCLGVFAMLLAMIFAVIFVVVAAVRCAGGV